jgi:hypothetical protein
MRKFTVFAAMVIFIVMIASFADAWTVTIHNNDDCGKDVAISVTGEHLFWTQVDCRTTVSAGKVGTCQMPEGICPVIISGQYYLDGSQVDTNSISCTGNDSLKVCCCWDVRVIVKKKEGSKACYIYKYTI